MEEQRIDALIEATASKVEEAWRTWGAVEPEVLSHLINPAFTGGPRWPSLRQAFRVVRSAGQVLVASDGLSDPFDEDGAPDDINGFELEIFGLTPDPLPKVHDSWLFHLVWQVSQLAANHGHIVELLEDITYVSTELNSVLPASEDSRFVTADGRVGALLGLEHASVPTHVDGPLSMIYLVNVKLLTLEELEFAKGGTDARRELAERFAREAAPLASSLTRKSIV